MSLSETGPSKKRKKVSGLTGLELWMALAALQSVKMCLKEITPSDNEDDTQLQSELLPFGSEFEDMLDTMLEMMQSKVDGPQALSFEDLKRLNIEFGGPLELKMNYDTRIDAIDALGAAELWSSDGLYRHLKRLQGLVPRTNEAAARLWIDAFFFRADAMTPPSKKLLLTLEQSAPATAVIRFNLTTVGGFIDHTAVTVNESDAGAFLGNLNLDKLKKRNHTLFVLEAKRRDLSLQDHVPQAVCEMYACAKTLEKDVIRGALTDGQEWIFIILKMKPDGNGGTYAQSEELYIMTRTFNRKEINRVACSMISGIIAHWINHSYDDIGDDDWFTIQWT